MGVPQNRYRKHDPHKDEFLRVVVAQLEEEMTSD